MKEEIARTIKAIDRRIEKHMERANGNYLNFFEWNAEDVYQLHYRRKYYVRLADRRAGDAEELQRVRDFNKDLKRAVIEYDMEATEIVRDSLLRHPDLDNPYAKSLITDGRGQNKDRKSQYRLEYTDVTDEAQFEESAGAGAASTRDLY